MNLLQGSSGLYKLISKAAVTLVRLFHLSIWPGRPRHRWHSQENGSPMPRPFLILERYYSTDECSLIKIGTNDTTCCVTEGGARVMLPKPL
jgi:hypothetical protein